MAVAFADNRPRSNVRQPEFGRAAGGFSEPEKPRSHGHRTPMPAARAEGEKRVDSPPLVQNGSQECFCGGDSVMAGVGRMIGAVVLAFAGVLAAALPAIAQQMRRPPTIIIYGDASRDWPVAGHGALCALVNHRGRPGKVAVMDIKNGSGMVSIHAPVMGATIARASLDPWHRFQSTPP